MSHKRPSREETPKMTWKAKKLVKRQEDTLKEVRWLKEEKEMQQSESRDSKNTPQTALSLNTYGKITS